MSNFPTAQSPQEIVTSLIHLIETAESSSHKLNLTMALATLTRNEKFIDHLASIGFTDHETATPPPIDHSSSLAEIKLFLLSLTARGNLIVTAGPSTPSKVLHEASPHIGSIIHKAFWQDFSTPSPPVRPNVRWSKLLIHDVPTNVSKSRGPSNPDECHEALLATNPSYSSLLITRKPSWVCSPSSYHLGSISSLVVAFEDPDGSTLRSLLQNRHLYIFGMQAKASETSDEEDVNIILDTPTSSCPVAPTSLRPQAQTPVAPLVATVPKPTNRRDRPLTFSPPTTRSTRK
ncbi:hypothetical protein BC827DRAFT_1267379 [Russula dissimulans]|nr:hypothetical protein BC827DRAFT_1267379 [Russula dissimulans]